MVAIGTYYSQEEAHPSHSCWIPLIKKSDFNDAMNSTATAKTELELAALQSRAIFWLTRAFRATGGGSSEYGKGARLLSRSFSRKYVRWHFYKTLSSLV